MEDKAIQMQKEFFESLRKVKKVWSRGHKQCGDVITVSSRYCGGCQGEHYCLIVRWPDGKKTKPCTAGMKTISETEWEIV